jgi:deoxyadenosine/deoxycytidine kinase
VSEDPDTIADLQAELDTIAERLDKRDREGEKAPASDVAFGDSFPRWPHPGWA